MYKIKKIEGKKDKYWISFYNNPLYPDGKGGQLGDRGSIDGIPILEVKQKDGEVWAVLDERPKGPECDIDIDQERRRDIAIQHTAQHILSASFVKVADLQTVSFHMGDEYSTIDLDVNSVGEDVIREVLSLSNETIRSSVPVVERFTTYAEAKELTLRRKLSNKLTESDKIRLIEIPGFDLAACGGFHVKNTGEIGVLFVIRHEKIKGKLTRIYFIAGPRVDSYLYSVNKVVGELSEIFKAPYVELVDRAKRLIDESREERAKISKIGRELAEYIEKDLPYIEIGGYKIKYYEGEEYVTSSLPKVYTSWDMLILKTKDSYSIFSSSVSVKNLIDRIRKDYPNIKGGGGKNQGRFMGDIPMSSVLSVIEKWMEIYKGS